MLEEWVEIDTASWDAEKIAGWVTERVSGSRGGSRVHSIYFYSDYKQAVDALDRMPLEMGSYEDHTKRVRRMEKELAGMQLAWGIRWGEEVRVFQNSVERGGGSPGAGSWPYKQGHLLFASCRPKTGWPARFYFQDSGIGLDEAAKLYRTVVADAGLPIEEVETAFSRGGWFWPDDHFPQANPLLLHFDVVPGRKFLRHNIYCGGVEGPNCRFLPSR
jgi:hypothetical protein